jgi:hypothetical protein
VKLLNDPDEDGGGFWLRNIQRPFVWSEEQIGRLFDSILREYPISTLLIWKTKSPIRRRKFIDNFKEEYADQLSRFYVPENTKTKCLVLDGQQRLQSLYIGLCGSYEGHELYLDILSGDVAAPDDIKYKFRFMESTSAAFPWLKFKDLVFGLTNPVTVAQDIIHNAGRELTKEEEGKVSTHVGLIFKAFHADDGIGYQELDSTENKDLYTEEDVVEIFIRANSGGTRLGKSDLLFSLLASSWEKAGEHGGATGQAEPAWLCVHPRLHPEGMPDASEPGSALRGREVPQGRHTRIDRGQLGPHQRRDFGRA